ncbi:MAG TPA: GNAT family N-acetyltransferase [Candidatus Dependentiae bacterium]|nr:GNAT family N-acetyltransferase [Candidatus Dependentiae bacterium]HRQ63074.1 GNAT family N-acetyltransferase [Candidatus Dependentiae bacterium]
MNTKLLSLFLVAGLFHQARSEVTIEQFQEERDMSAIEEILKAYPTLTHESHGCADGTTKKYLSSTDYMTHVIRVDGNTIGFINYATKPIFYVKHFLDPLKLISWYFSGYGFIQLIGIDTKYQHQGYGRQLLHYALQKLKKQGVSKVMLCTDLDNTINHNFYEKEGFEREFSAPIQNILPNLFYIKVLNAQNL